MALNCPGGASGGPSLPAGDKIMLHIDANGGLLWWHDVCFVRKQYFNVFLQKDFPSELSTTKHIDEQNIREIVRITSSKAKAALKLSTISKINRAPLDTPSHPVPSREENEQEIETPRLIFFRATRKLG